MYNKPHSDGYMNGKYIGYDNPKKEIKISNFLLGKIEYDDYSLNIVTMGEEYINAPKGDKYEPYFIIIKDYKDPNQKVRNRIAYLSVFKPEYFDFGFDFKMFKMNNRECKDLYKFLCSFDYSNTMDVFLEFFANINYTQYSGYIDFLNRANKNVEDWKELPLDAGCPKYNDKMNIRKFTKE